MKRIVAFFMAFAIVLGLTPDLFNLEVQAAVGDPIIITFKDAPGGDNQVASVIRGAPISVVAKNTENTGMKDDEDAMRIVKRSEDAEKRNPYFKLTGSKSEYEITPILKSDLALPDTDPDQAAVGTYDITTNYISFQSVARSRQTAGEGRFGGTFELQEANTEKWIPVQITSTTNLVYKAPSGGVSTGEWSFDSGATGLFIGWDTVVTRTGHVDGTASTKEYYTFDVTDEKSELRQFRFYPNVYWELPTTVTNPDGTTTTTRTPMYNMRTDVDNTFEIKFNYDPSNTLILQVQDPRTVLKQVVEDATNGNPSVNKFVELTGETDQYNYITDKIILTTSTEKFGQKINLKWTWEPTNPLDSGVMTPAYINQSSIQMLINAMKDDVSGSLRVTASYELPQLNRDVLHDNAEEVSADLEVNVHGLGKPAFPIDVKKTTGGVSGGADTIDIVTYGEGKHLPSAIYNMDVYKNGVNGYTETKNPYKLEFNFNAGGADTNGFTRRLVIDAEGAEDAVSVTIKAGGGEIPYKFGDNFDNNNGSSTITVTVVALEKAPENLNLTFRFFVAGINNSLREEPLAQEKVNIVVGDSSPDTTAELEKFTVKDMEGKIDLPDFVFDPKTYDYSNPMIEVPNEMGTIRIKPHAYKTTGIVMGYTVERMNDQRLWVDVTGDGGGEDALAPTVEKKWIDDLSNPDKSTWSITSGDSANRYVRLIPDVPMRITIKVRAQDPNIVKSYVFVLRRQMPSTDSSLKKLTVVGTKDGEDFADGFTPAFAPDVYEGYGVVVPYNVEEVRAEFDTTHPKAVGKQIKPEISLLSRMFGTGENIKIPEPSKPGSDPVPPVEIDIQVKSQSGLMPDEPWWSESSVTDSGIPKDEYNSTYKLKVRRALPGRDATLASLAVTDKADAPLTYTPAFKPDTDTDAGDFYELSVPYSVSEIKLTAATTHKYASMKVSGEGFSEMELKSGKVSKPIPVKWYDNGDPHIITITATAEDRQTVKTYVIHLLRAAPSTDASLATLGIKDQADAPLTNFEFDPETTDYQLSVPYETKKVTFTPKATSALVSEIKVDGRKVTDGQPSKMLELPEYPNVKTVVVEVLAEDGTTKMSYRVSISRQQPSSEARLSALSATGLLDNKLTPVFAPKTLSYSATLIENAPGVTITAVTVSPYATLTIDGKKAISGTASEQIAILDVTQAVQIVVTAQDGKTKNSYRINFTNPNLVPKSSNADLARLKVNYGEMAPGFKPSITGYEVYVKEDDYSVDIMPRAADKGAEVKVFAGSKEIGDENGNFAQSIADGENEFVVKVTSSDKTKTKEYSLLVYRNEEDKQGTLRPITADDIDYENSGDVIIVDITKYSRVAANVFTELKNYPEKTIIFEGNDYSLQFSAAELEKVIPVTAIYDFKMSFNSPLANEIYDEIDSYKNNKKADTVLVHFGYDGVLPGPATLTMSLGKRYRNDTYYWHYYNEERGRLDYYGSFETNSKGTFTVPLEHMSTYVVADMKLYGSEDKSGGILDIGEQAVIEKQNPDTGVLGGSR